MITNFNIEFSSDSVRCLFGPSGCGKTTLLNVLAGLTPADSGFVHGLQSKKFSYVFQEERLLTAETNLFWNASWRKRSASRIDRDHKKRLISKIPV